jgi:hypothetical protein
VVTNESRAERLARLRAESEELLAEPLEQRDPPIIPTIDPLKAWREDGERRDAARARVREEFRAASEHDRLATLVEAQVEAKLAPIREMVKQSADASLAFAESIAEALERGEAKLLKLENLLLN